MATMSFIKGPFVFKSDIIIPAGTPYTTKDPKNPGTQFTKRQITNRVQSPPTVDLHSSSQMPFG